MYLKKLTLFETVPKLKPIREVEFKLGCNFIVDAGKNQEKSNSIGKTTALKLIDICLGAKDRKYIYTDPEIGVNTDLQSYIENSKIQVQLEMASEWESADEKIVLAVDLFNRGNRYVDNEKYNQKEYWELLNNLLFENKENTPTLRQSINMFVRVDQAYDNNKFLKFLDGRNSNALYENIYSFLFDLKSQDINNKIFELNEDISSHKEAIRKLKQINGFTSINAISQKMLVLEDDIKSITSELGVLVDSKKFKENEKKINEIRIEYAHLNTLLDEYSFKKQRVDETLDNAKKESEELLDTSVLKNLYDDTQAYLVELKKTFNDLIEFNTKLNHNKINYFQKQAEKWDEKITKVQQDREALFNNHKDIIMLIKENKIEAYTTLQEKLGSLREEMGRNKQIKDVHEKLETALSKASKDLSELKESIRSSDNNDSKIELFNKYFSKYSKLTNGEGYLLYETDEGFPFAVDNVARGLSTGDKKSIIASFDLAYQKFSKEIGKTTPNFFVHDVIETLDQVALTSIVNIANEIECQYIVAVLKEKIDNNKVIKAEDIRLTLSETERLFRM